MPRARARRRAGRRPLVQRAAPRCAVGQPAARRPAVAGQPRPAARGSSLKQARQTRRAGGGQDESGDGDLQVHPAHHQSPRATLERQRAGSAAAAAQPAARPLCPDYRRRAVRLATARRLRGCVGDLRKAAGRRRDSAVRWCAWLTPVRAIAGPAAKALAASRNGRYSGCTCHVSPSCCRYGGARSLRARGAARDARSEAKEQVEFGIKVAQNGLWNEALYRWEKATELDPTYAAAWNNLAIAYEHEGKFDGREEGLREGPPAGSEEPDDPAELRSLQRNQ